MASIASAHRKIRGSIMKHSPEIDRGARDARRLEKGVHRALRSATYATCSASIFEAPFQIEANCPNRGAVLPWSVEAFYRGIPAGSPVDGVLRGAASWQNVSTVVMGTRKSHGRSPNAPNAE